MCCKHSRNMSRECAFCFGNFKIHGTKHTSVPLFNSSSNTEIVTLVKGLQNVDTIILSVLVSHIGIKLQKEKFNRRSVCKKCARKVISMYNIFVEICEAVKINGLRCTEAEVPSSSPNAHSLSPHAKTTTRPMASNKNVRK